MSEGGGARLGVGVAVLVFSFAVGAVALRGIQQSRRAAVPAPDFTLHDVDNQSFSLSELRGRTIVLFFGSTRGQLTNEYVPRITGLARRYAQNPDVRIVFIDSKVAADDQAALDELRVFRSLLEPNMVLLMDPGGSVAFRYGVQRTGTAVVIDRHGYIRYRGAFDDNRDERLVSRHYCEEALASVVKGRSPNTVFTQAFGHPIR